MKKTSSEKGITLIALIITIVVLLILAVVTINSIQGDGIIRYAQNAADDYTAKANEEQGALNTLLSQIEATQPITWKKTSTGDLAIGSTVEAKGEVFYVIGGDTVGTEISSNTQTVILLAKNNLKADGSAQDITGAINPCAFTTASNLIFAENENLNNNSTIKQETTSAVYKAKKYGETLGVTTGRLMLYNEAEGLQTANRDILYGKNGKSSGNGLDFWLGTASDPYRVYPVRGEDEWFGFVDISTDETAGCGLRPVIEISKSSIL